MPRADLITTVNKVQAWETGSWCSRGSPSIPGSRLPIPHSRHLPCSSSLPLSVVPTSVNRSSRSEEHTSELQSLMRISYAVLCLKNKNYLMKLQLSHTNNKPRTHHNK